MPDLYLDARRPFALVTTVRRAGPHASRVHPQLDLDLPGCALRLRFADPQTLALFSEAVTDLFADAVDHFAQGEADVRVRVLQLWRSGPSATRPPEGEADVRVMQPHPLQLELPY